MVNGHAVFGNFSAGKVGDLVAKECFIWVDPDRGALQKKGTCDKGSDVSRRIEELGDTLPMQMDDDGLIRLDLDLRKEYNEILLPEELLWFQKSREKWVRNDDAKLQKEAVNSYKNLFCCTYPVDISAMDGVDVPKLSQRGVADLLKPVTKDEVNGALLSMDSLKSPGMDVASNLPSSRFIGM
uniref:Uncharacterized protein n=1 Tax=Populus alba TaxID=43335 RepID=A0A4U5MCP6_POPAL|nr:hypothetical protein D5086_0000310190 [Populus alba]